MIPNEVSLELSNDDIRELEENWTMWSDESYAIHAAHIFRDALIRAGYMKEERWDDNV